MSKNENTNLSFITGVECTPENLSELSDSIEFFVDAKPWHYGFDIFVRGKNYHLSMPSSDDRYVVTGFKLTKQEPEHKYDTPFRIRPHEAQNLMDELWRAGVRPSEHNLPPASTTQAVRDHLADMQKIAFMYLEQKDD